MITNNDAKQIIFTPLKQTVGHIEQYLINKDGLIRAISIRNYNTVYYTLHDDIIEISDTISVKDLLSAKPSGLNRCHSITPGTKVNNEHSAFLGTITSLDLDDKRINALITESEHIEPADIIRSKDGTIIVKEKCPPPYVENKYSSFQYEWILGRRARKSLFSTSNTPIIVEGEIVTLENIIGAIIENKLIDLINIVI